MGEITLEMTAEEVRRKFRALTPWPSVYFFIVHADKRMRVKVKKINTNPVENDLLTASDIIEAVVPEGKHEMSFGDFKRGYLR